MLDVIFTERPLHPKEKVLEQALQWCKMADPSSAYLVVKKVPRGEAIDIFTGESDKIKTFRQVAALCSTTSNYICTLQTRQ